MQCGTLGASPGPAPAPASPRGCRGCADPGMQSGGAAVPSPCCAGAVTGAFGEQRGRCWFMLPEAFFRQWSLSCTVLPVEEMKTGPSHHLASRQCPTGWMLASGIPRWDFVGRVAPQPSNVPGVPPRRAGSRERTGLVMTWCHQGPCSYLCQEVYLQLSGCWGTHMVPDGWCKGRNEPPASSVPGTTCLSVACARPHPAPVVAGVYTELRKVLWQQE